MAADATNPCYWFVSDPPQTIDSDYSEAQYESCVDQHANANCNPGYCLPATETDPVECLNLKTSCAQAIGAIPVGFIPGDPENPQWCRSPADNRCGGDQGCCMCDWCCDLDPSTCIALGGEPMTDPNNVNNPRSCQTGQFAANTQARCQAMNVRKPCRSVGYRKALVAGRWVWQSVWQEEPNDIIGTDHQCRVSHGVKAKGTSGIETGRWFATVCNHWNWRCDNTKYRRPGRKRRVNGRWEARVSLRQPCPEPPCDVRVGCPIQ